MISALGIVIILCLAFYLFLIAPRRQRRQQWPDGFFQHDFAHRGLYGGSVPENSLTAFQLAVNKGYGIELDVQLTADGELAVHHDASLLRTCGVDRKISEMTAGEIRRYPLGENGESVPFFQEVLELVHGQAPLIVELKTAGRRNPELARKAYETLRRYGGNWVVESFDPRLMRWFRKNAPQVIRGQLAYDPRLGGPPGDGKKYVFLADLLMNFISRPDFVAYCHETDSNLSFRLLRRLFRPVLAAWTVQDTDTCQRLRSQYDQQIFEGFEP
ncbi:MAG: glycerophosphodiester phosphodiesterase [Clostridia bacterium]|nr:glycerophosphodiester phosphodiesterase [Clostridia bacterium]